jgi:hypothetical protein
MTTISQEGEEIKRAIKWVSASLEDNPDQPVHKLVEKAVFEFDLSPLDAEFLMRFFQNRPVGQ